MINEIVLETLSGGNKQPDSGKAVSVYEYNSSDVAGGAPNGSKIGDCSEISGTGVYTIDISESKKATIVVAGKCVEGQIGVLLHGEKALDDSVDTSAIVDSAVTNDKLSEFGDF